jgi:hypothetical protein
MLRMTDQSDAETQTEAGPAAAERGLMRAVLEDAVRCLSGQVGPVRERPQLALEARAWIEAEDPRWPYSFVNVCDHLGFEAEQLRTRLLRHAPEVDAAGTPEPATRTRRESPAEHEIMQMIRAGRPLRVIAETFGISISKASILSCGLASRIKAERDEQIGRLRRAGWTHRALAAQFGLSRIRIMRICARRARAEEEENRTAA